MPPSGVKASERAEAGIRTVSPWCTGTAAPLSSVSVPRPSMQIDERVERREVERLGAGQIVERRGEIRARHQLHARVLRRLVMRPVIGQHGVVDGALRQFGVQFAGVAVGIAAVEIVDAVGDVRGLLDFGDERPRADRVHTSRGQEKHVARCDLVVGQDVRDGVVSDAGLVLGRRYLLREARTQVRVLIRRHHVPHFGLALGFVAFPCQLVVRVHLDREILPGVDELDQQRELLAETPVVGFAQQRRAVAGDQFRERCPGFGAFGESSQLSPMLRWSVAIPL